MTPSLKPTADPTPQPTTQYRTLRPSSAPSTQEQSTSQSYVEFNYDSSSNISSSPSKKPVPAFESQVDVEKFADSNATGGGEDEELVDNYLDASSEGSSSVMALWASAAVFLAILIFLIGVITLNRRRKETTGDAEHDEVVSEPGAVSSFDPVGWICQQICGVSEPEFPGMAVEIGNSTTGPWVEGQDTVVSRSPSYFTLDTFPVDNRGSRASCDD